MPYVTASEVRALIPLTTSDISDADLNTLITHATRRLNQEILTHVFEEKVLAIDDERENKINGSNTTYYTRNKPLADLDDDGDVDTDDITVYQFTSEGTRSTLTVSSVDADLGQFVLSSAPASNVTLRIVYRYSPIDITMGTIHGLVKNACIYLAGSLAYMSLSPADITKYTVDKISVVRKSAEAEALMKRYNDEVALIKNKMAIIKKGLPIPSEIPQLPGEPLATDRERTEGVI